MFGPLGSLPNAQELAPRRTVARPSPQPAASYIYVAAARLLHLHMSCVLRCTSRGHVHVAIFLCGVACGYFCLYGVSVGRKTESFKLTFTSRKALASAVKVSVLQVV